MHHSHRSAFTILELAMVLTIISLIVGTIFVGTSVLRSSKLQSVMNSVENYKGSIKLFKEKYNELPGDFTRATSFWGAADANAADCPNTPGTGTQTCNGDGNGVIGSYDPSNTTPLSSALEEPLLLWQHLTNAGMLDGAYPGATVGVNLVPGTNIPSSEIPGAGYYVRYALPGAATGVFNADYYHVIMMGLPHNDETPPINPALNPTDAYELDQKMDDGKPGTGKTLSFTNATNVYGQTPACATGTSASAEYNVGTDSIECAMIFITGF
jgi:type II secretory pathway pseudopilin PulG